MKGTSPVKGFTIAVAGKGGTGKTLVSALLVRDQRKHGAVLAIDADPDANLAAALGLPPEKHPAPLSQMRELIAERTGSSEGYGGYFKLNPRVDDIPDTYAAHVGHIRLLVLGGVEKGGGGCICPATVLVKALLSHLILARDDALVMDMEAGIEHLGRATGESMDAMLVVINDSAWSLQTAARIQTLAAQVGVGRLYAVANQIAPETDLDALRNALGEIPLIGQLPFDPKLRSGALRLGNDGSARPTDAAEAHMPAIEEILAKLQIAIG